LLSSREGCCNAVLESLACGVPVVTTPVGDNVRFVRHGTNGYIVPVDDESAAEVALLSALRGHQWNSLDIAGSLDIASWDAVAIRVRDFLNRMLQ
jgi:glycosyltransferase involved in cell wall biosynthesis